MKSRRFAAASLALAIVAQSGAAHAQQTCLTEREAAHLAVYAVPAGIQGVQQKCARSLKSNGFLATRGPALAARYAALQVETWPSAKGALLKFVGGGAGDSDKQAARNPIIGDIAALPDEALRPLVDALFAQKLAESIRPGDCSMVERGLSLIAPLNPRDAGALIGFVMGFTRSKQFPICPQEGA